MVLHSYYVLLINISGSMALSVIAVSINVSLLIDEVAIDIFITLAPNCFPANSNEVRVLVESSKNKLIIFLFEKNFFLISFI